MIRINLEHNNGFTWYEDKGTYVKGYMYRSGEYLSGKEIADIFGAVNSEDDLFSVLNDINGCYSIILNRDQLYMASDPLRIFPLFYTLAEGDLHISDNAYLLQEKRAAGSIDREALTEFQATGFVTGRDSLFESIFQVQAGEMVWGDEKNLNRKFFSSYQAESFLADNYGMLIDRLESTFDNVFRRMLQSIHGRCVVIPLSGGYDSRLVAVMMKKYKYPDVLCYTYGRAGNMDLQASRNVAEQLDYPWVFVEYNDELIQGYLDDPEFLNYYRYSSNAVSMFFMQEYFAVRHLRDHKLVPEDAVFVPGHSGDFIAGSMFLKHGLPDNQVPAEKLVQKIFDIKCIYSRPSGPEKEQLMSRISKSLDEKDMVPDAASYTIYEDWDLKEKFAKFIVNSCNVYSFFGYQYRLPLWDRELTDFFRNVPYVYKLNKKLYDEVLVKRIFELHKLNFENEVQAPAGIQKQEFVKSRLRKWMPFWKRKPAAMDALFYREITQIMLDDLRSQGKSAGIEGGAYNSLIVQWYIHQLRKNLK